MEKEYRNLCQVFTPSQNVKELLDWCDYRKDLFDKKIIENSCGNGHILVEIVKRYIIDAKSKKKSNAEIKNGLETNIYGIEYDNEKYLECIDNLNKATAEYDIYDVKWEKNIQKVDALSKIVNNKFDYVVGNPPYIKYKSLNLSDRAYLRENFTTCQKGKFDYCYAFIELSVKSLKDGGKMAYLIPSSIFKNVFAKDLRDYIKPHIVEIKDYTTTKLFSKETNDKGVNRITSSSVIIIEKNSNRDEIIYTDITKNETIKLKKSKLGEKWIFTIDTNNKGRKLGDYFLISNTIATLYNKAYIIKNYTETERYIITSNNFKIEKEVLKNTISPKNFNANFNEKIIFPYYYDKKGILCHYKKEEFESKFPKAVKYLKTFNKELKQRCSDKTALWFEYGRSQALSHSNKEKLLLSTIITNKVVTRILPKENIPYSGIYIIRKNDLTLKDAEKILKSKEFYEYISKKGIIASGNSIRITSKDISEYRF